MKIYIAGPMAGYPSHNWPEFNRIEAILVEKGYKVVNPAKLHGCYEDALKSGRNSCLRTDIKQLVDCDAILLLNGWQQSRGARLEYRIAAVLEIKMYWLAELEQGVL